MRLLVIDTNVALDLLVFRDPSTAPLAAGLADGSLRWIATDGMRGEFGRVLGYPAIAARLDLLGDTASQVLEGFDRHARIVQVAPLAPLACSDPDDQPFIDLAVHHGSILLSKDAAVLALKQRLAALRVVASAVLPAPPRSLDRP